jgi:hypothetical protein
MASNKTLKSIDICYDLNFSVSHEAPDMSLGIKNKSNERIDIKQRNKHFLSSSVVFS